MASLLMSGFQKKHCMKVAILTGYKDYYKNIILFMKHEHALWFASTKFGDDKDRVVKKSSGEWTYVAADIAYLLNKAKRGFDHLVMVLGHDHHSYAVRLARHSASIRP